jgi:hypothetical protein
MRVNGDSPILRIQTVPRIQPTPAPRLDTERPVQRGYVENVDIRGAQGANFAVNQRTLSRNGFIKMRSFVTKVASNVGRYSVDRQDPKFGVTEVVNNDLRVRPQPGKISSVFQKAKSDQLFNITSYEKTRQPVELSVDRSADFYEKLRALSAKSYSETEIVFTQARKTIDIIA